MMNFEFWTDFDYFFVSLFSKHAHKPIITFCISCCTMRNNLTFFFVRIYGRTIGSHRYKSNPTYNLEEVYYIFRISIVFKLYRIIYELLSERKCSKRIIKEMISLKQHRRKNTKWRSRFHRKNGTTIGIVCLKMQHPVQQGNPNKIMSNTFYCVVH